MLDRPFPSGAIAQLVAEHRRLDIALRRFEAAVHSGDRCDRVVPDIVGKLLRHAHIEERYLYPTVREVVVGGETLAEEHEEDHEITQRVICELELIDPSGAGFERAARILVQMCRRHMNEEEEELFPRLQHQCSRDQLRVLDAQIRRARSEIGTTPMHGFTRLTG